VKQPEPNYGVELKTGRISDQGDTYSRVTEQTNDTNKNELQMGRNKCKVDNLRRGEYRPGVNTIE
jgi:hypothetical protein